MTKPLYTSALLEHYAELQHGFFGTDIPFGKELDAQETAHSIAKLGALFHVPPHHLRFMHQVHGTSVATLTSASPAELPEADAMIVTEPRIAIGVLTADCVPLLFYAPDKKIAAVAHAGWRGAIGGVVAQTVHRLGNLGAATKNLCVALGPCISQDSYEVDQRFYNDFLKHQDAYTQFFKPASHTAHYMFDLPGFVTHLLRQEGIEKIDVISPNTYTHDHLFSYRRWTHQPSEKRGARFNQVSMLMIHQPM